MWRVSRLYPPNFTGVGIQAQREDKELIKRGVSVYVLTAGISAARTWRGKTVEMDGILVNYLLTVNYPLWLDTIRIKLIYKLFIFIFDLLSSLSFAIGSAYALCVGGRQGDIIVFESVDTFLFIPLWIARFKKIPTIVRMSLLGADDPYSRLVRARKGQFLEHLKLRAFKDADVVVAICTAMIESGTGAGIEPAKMVYLPHGVDTTLYAPVDEESKEAIRVKLGLGHDKKYIVFVGSAIERKGIDVMVDAFIAVRQVLDDVELLIVGPSEFDPRVHYNSWELGALVDKCKDKIAGAHLGSSVHWAGQVENVHEFMRAADVFCLPTRREGFGLVIAEAMACGLPVVVANLAGVTSDIVVSDVDGILIAGHAPHDYANATLDILDQPGWAVEIGRSARQHVLREFSLDGAIEKWLGLFDNLSQS
jgi:glycosyltransferase involved in cell wall biosynthesis